jgi:dTDP-4-amino-4,6-dideoxygalactose transaminase
VSEWKVPLADVRLRPEEIGAATAAYESGWLSMGPRTDELERAFEAYTGAPHALAAANGTAALHLITAAAGLGPGDEVIVPSLTFVATVNAIAYTGARPVFAEIASLTEPWLSAAAAEAAIGPRTKAIMTMTYGGHPGQTEALAALAADRGLVLLEDTAHAAGSRLGGRHLGTFGSAGAFSFFSNKNIGIGEGGMVVTTERELAERMRLLRSHGMTTLTWDRHRGHASGYDVVALGFNYRIDEPRAALVAERLKRLDDENRARGAMVERYRAAVAELPGIEAALPPLAGAEPANHLFCVVLDESIDRDALRAGMAERGVQTSVHYPPVHRFSIYADGAPDLPLTDAYGTRAVTLPLFAHMTGSQQDLVIESLAAALPGRRAA